MVAFIEKSSETIPVSTIAIGITSTLLVDSDGKTLDIVEAIFTHRTGGKIFSLASAGTPVAGGGSGNKERVASDEWIVRGSEDLTNFEMIKQTSESDATVDVQLYGYP